MLLQFTVSNYKCFTEPVTFSMLASKEKRNKNNISDSGLLKSSGIFGANDAGKTNFITAIQSLKDFVLYDDNFIYRDNNDAIFEIIFIKNNITYRYGIKFAGNVVAEEWLYYIPNKRKVLIFHRIVRELKLGSKFKKYKYVDFYHCRAFLYELFNKTNNEIINEIIKELSSYRFFTFYDRNIKKVFHNKFAHQILKNVSASETTNLILLAIVDLIAKTLSTGGTLFVDDFGDSIHHNIQLYLLGLFNSSEMKWNIGRNDNPNNAQLIFTSHNLLLLDNEDFRRDQIWFIDKIKNVTKLYSLIEYKDPAKDKIRKEAPLSKDYINGRVGAIPFIRQFKPLFEHDNID